jgi:hypothetical protein
MKALVILDGRHIPIMAKPEDTYAVLYRVGPGEWSVHRLCRDEADARAHAAKLAATVPREIMIAPVWHQHN